MHSAKFEIACEHPEIVKQAVEIDDKSEVKYTVGEKKLVLEIESDSLKLLMKIAYSACNRVLLSIDTTERFGKDS